MIDMKRKPLTSIAQRPPNPRSVLRASTIPDRRKQAARLACRKRVIL